jgi:hypothetical protein
MVLVDPGRAKNRQHESEQLFERAGTAVSQIGQKWKRAPVSAYLSSQNEGESPQSA